MNKMIENEMNSMDDDSVCLSLVPPQSSHCEQ